MQLSKSQGNASGQSGGISLPAIPGLTDDAKDEITEEETKQVGVTFTHQDLSSKKL